MISRGLFITGTDTGVGKTEVACALLRGHRARGLDLGAMKPAQSGHAPGEPSDADRLRAAAGDRDPAELVCPYTFAAPLAPAVAARLEARAVSLARILDAAGALAGRHAALLVEGAGGILTPLTERETSADLAVALGPRGLAVHGVVLVRTSPKGDASEPYNAAEIERLTGARVLATVPFERDIALRERRMADELAVKVQF